MTERIEDSLQTYENLRSMHQMQLREFAVKTACVVLHEQGPEALTVRNISARMKCSTKIIYSLFGSKDNLVTEVYLENFRILEEKIRDISLEGTLEDYLIAIGDAYWLFAYQNPNEYRLMCGEAFQSFKLEDACLIGAAGSFYALMEGLTYYKEQKLLRTDDVLMTAKLLWATMHGVLHLASIGHFANEPDLKVVFDAGIQQFIKSLK